MSLRIRFVVYHAKNTGSGVTLVEIRPFKLEDEANSWLQEQFELLAQSVELQNKLDVYARDKKSFNSVTYNEIWESYTSIARRIEVEQYEQYLIQKTFESVV